jgi:ribosomal protein S18 acetylase RimI-like enzyme
MNHISRRKINIIELTKQNAPPNFVDSYETSGYYDVSVSTGRKTWKTELVLKTFEKPVEKRYEAKFFENYVEEPRLFAASFEERQVGWIELGYDSWNNRIRVWEFFIKQEFRRKGIGTLLMDHAMKIAKEKGARMLVLETQTCNAPAISFYQKYGFALIGFDIAAYSNDDISRKEVRLELGLRL